METILFWQWVNIPDREQKLGCGFGGVEVHLEARWLVAGFSPSQQPTRKWIAHEFLDSITHRSGTHLFGVALADEEGDARFGKTGIDFHA